MLDDHRSARFRRLYDAELASVLGYALRRSSRDDAADVVAETFLVAWRRLDDVPEPPETRPWLYGVARRVLANQQRGGRRRDRLTERLAGQVQSVLPDDWPDRLGDHELVHAALARLAERDRELLRLVAWEGLTPGEIAIVMDLPAPTIRTRLHRARLRMLGEIERLGWQPERRERFVPAGHLPSEERPLLPAPEEAT